MRIQIFFIVFLVSILSCESIQDQMHSLKDDTLRVSSNMVTSKGSDDTVFFMHERTKTQKVFISVLPSDQWIDSMQQINGEEDWNKIVVDNEHYNYQTKKYLEGKGYVEMLRPKDGIWVIKRPGCHSNTIDFDTLAGKWGILIFNEDKEGYFYDGTEPETDLNNF